MQLLFSARETIATLVKYKCKTFITLTPGDWPCQFYCHQITYQCVKKFLSYQQPHQVNCENPQAASDHSAYSYPSFTISDNEQSAIQLVFSALHCVCDSNDRSSPHILEQKRTYCHFLPSIFISMSFGENLYANCHSCITGSSI